MAKMKKMNVFEAKKYLKEKYPNANVFEGVIKGGLYDVMIAQEWNEEREDFVDLEVVITY